jgi:hypothetical protein
MGSNQRSTVTCKMIDRYIMDGKTQIACLILVGDNRNIPRTGDHSPLDGLRVRIVFLGLDIQRAMDRQFWSMRCFFGGTFR